MAGGEAREKCRKGVTRSRAFPSREEPRLKKGERLSRRRGGRGRKGEITRRRGATDFRENRFVNDEVFSFILGPHTLLPGKESRRKERKDEDKGGGCDRSGFICRQPTLHRRSLFSCSHIEYLLFDAGKGGTKEG